MATTDRSIASILQRAESQLRELIAESATAGDYAAVDLARSAAGRINEMLTGLASPSPSPHGSDPNTSPLPNAAHAQRRNPQRRNSGSYPKFVVRKGVLHKIAWSKKDKQEYVHKIPKNAFDRTVDAIASLAKAGQSPFLADQVVTQTKLTGDAIPIYQIYVVLAFLRHGDMIQRDGRDGYLARAEVEDEAQRLWGALPAKQAGSR